MTPNIQSPNFRADALQLMGLVNSISTALAGKESFAAITIKSAIDKGHDHSLVVSTVYDMITDNEPAVAFLIGDALVKRVKELYVPVVNGDGAESEEEL